MKSVVDIGSCGARSPFTEDQEGVPDRHATGVRQEIGVSLGMGPALCATRYYSPRPHPELSRSRLHPVHGWVGVRLAWVWLASQTPVASLVPDCTKTGRFLRAIEDSSRLVRSTRVP